MDANSAIEKGFTRLLEQHKPLLAESLFNGHQLRDIVQKIWEYLSRNQQLKLRTLLIDLYGLLYRI